MLICADFPTLFSTFSNISNPFSCSVNAGYHGWNSQNAWQKQSDLGLPSLSRPFWQASSARKFRAFTVSYCKMEYFRIPKF